MENTVLIPMTMDVFKSVLSDTVRKELEKISSVKDEPKQTELITRAETARILGISLPTLHDWTKKGIIVGYRIASRVRYKKAEILESVEQIRTLKYRRAV